MSRQFIQGQQTRHRFAENFRLGETVEDFRSLIPQKYGPAEAKTNDRLFGIRKEHLQQRIDIRLGQHFAEIGPWPGGNRRRTEAETRIRKGEETHWREEKAERAKANVI